MSVSTIAVKLDSDQVQILVAQAAIFSDVSGALRRNPALRERSWAMQREFRSTFIEVFGADWAILPPKSADEKLHELYSAAHRCRAREGGS